MQKFKTKVSPSRPDSTTRFLFLFFFKYWQTISLHAEIIRTFENWDILLLKPSYIAENTQEVPVAGEVGFRSLPKTISKDLFVSTNRIKGVRMISRKLDVKDLWICP